MRTLTINKKAKLADLAEVKLFEENNNIQFPKSYLDFITQINPIDIEERVITVDSRTFYMDRFFPFDLTSSLSLQSMYENLKEFFENKYISFGCDSGGWQFVLSVQEQDYGKVYFCRMDEELSDALFLLANSFDEYIAKLEVYSDDKHNTIL